MAYDEGLAQRVREALEDRDDVSERKMFGGLAFLVGGNMAVGILGEELMVRVYDQRVHEPGFGVSIDTGELTPEQTVQEILAHLHGADGA